MSETSGYAVIDGDKILVRTVTDTPRGAMVNWLITEAGQTITYGTSRALLNRCFDKAVRRFDRNIRVVSVRITAPLNEAVANLIPKTRQARVGDPPPPAPKKK